ncbi:MAG: NAD(P)-dependent oxidoreductase [Chloroflexi bacterium]|nr:NAD(P)-dependent oxidoreductase [Chloroflexota bacterium]
MSERILVTGGLGAIGAWVCRALVARDVRPLVFDTRADMVLVRDIAEQVDLVLGDITDLAALLRVVKQHRVSRVIHLAALMPPACQADPLLALRVNLLGAVHVFEAARLMELERVVFISSKAAYGAISGEYGHPTYVPVAEDHPTRPTNVYGVTKQAVEGWALQYHRLYGVDVVGFRLGSTYGPGKQSRHGAVGLHSRLIECAMFGKPLRIERGGDQGDDVIYNRDVAQGIVKGCFAPTPEHKVFNLGLGRAVSLREFARAVQELFPQASIEVGPGLDYYGAGEGRGSYSVFDISRARAELDFNPEYEYPAGIEDYVRTVRSLGLEFGT